MPSDSCQTHPGRFSDGQTAAAVPAQVRLAPAGVEIVPEGGHAPVLWPYAELSAAAPLAKGDGDVLLRHATTPGATLFVADGQFIAAGSLAEMLISSNGEQWAKRISPVPGLVIGLAYGNGTFVAVGGFPSAPGASV